MHTSWFKKAGLAALFLSLCLGTSSAQIFPFPGEVNANNTNVRSDSTVSSRVICTLSRSQQLEVVSEYYEWYKIRLPKCAPLFIKKGVAECINYKDQTQICQNAKALTDRINVRLGPDESSAIVGRLDKNEIINIRGEKKDWYKIEAIQNSFGWINKKFVNKILPINKTDNAKEENTKEPSDNIVIEGIVKPQGKIFRRPATHKLITESNEIFLLKGDRAGLDTLNYHKVKITGKNISTLKQKYPVIEIIKMEVIN